LRRAASIVRRSHWGNGYATEAALRAIDWAWRSGKIVHIISVIRPDDPRSMKVAEKTGQCFERESIEPLNGERRLVFGVHCPRTDN
jgi:RimJ/RimL family protein N-acetyltransferase